MTIQQYASFEAGPAELNATSKLVKAWESKNAKNAAKAGGISLMALSLAACGGSDDTAAVVDGGTAADDTATDDTATTPVAVSDLQASVAKLVLSNSTSADGVDAAVLASASSAIALEVTGTTTAPTTVAATEEMLGDASEAVFAAIETVAVGVTAQYEGLTTLTATAAAGDEHFDLLVDALTATTSAGNATIDTAVAAADSLISAQLVTANNTVLTTTQTISASLTAAQSADLAAFTSTTALAGTNAATAVTNVDATAATAVEIAQGVDAFAASIVSAVIAATGLTSTAANTAAAKALLVAYINDEATSGIGVQASDTANANALQNAVVFDANTGLVIGVNAAADAAAIDVTPAATAAGIVDLMAAAADTLDAAAINLGAGGAAGTFGEAMEAINAYVAGGDGSIGGSDAEVQAVMAAQYTASQVAAIKADFDAVIAVFDDIVAAQNSADTLDVQANILMLQNDGSNIVMATGATAALSDDDDMVGYVTSVDNSVTVGSAAEAFGASGNDSLIISGEYTFVTIDKDDADAIATVDDLGNVSELEIFAYQNATSGDTVLYVERTAGEGHVEGATMSTITLVDTTFADLSQIFGDGFTVLSSEAAVIA